MLLVKVCVRPSPVHGRGLFAVESIPAGAPLWIFVPDADLRHALAEADAERLHYGFVSPHTGDLVECGDDARYWNFSPAEVPPNAVESRICHYGEALIVAARDIAPGEELLIDVASDADASRKLQPTLKAA